MTVAMEACGAPHYWARKIRKLDHDVILLPAQHVKAYQRRQKNDYNDAQTIAEACQHGIIRSVPIKALEQQDVRKRQRSTILTLTYEEGLLNDEDLQEC